MFEGNLTILWRSIIKGGKEERKNTDVEYSVSIQKPTTDLIELSDDVCCRMPARSASGGYLVRVACQ